MSQESFSAFKAKLATDETLGKDFYRALGTGGSAEDLIEFGQRHGFAFNLDDIKAHELSDQELEAVAGGATKTSASSTLMLACATGEHFKSAIITMR